jgi:dienelactone hydrolase
MFRSPLLSWLCLLLSSCVGTRLVSLDNLELSVPRVAAGTDWRDEAREILDAYERAPVLAPEDARLEPLFGGLTTLSYFGADAKSRTFDQKLMPPAAVSGGSLQDACAAQSPPVPIANDLPTFQPVWIPLARDGGAAHANVRCDERGRASGAGADESFCMFARAALQPQGAHSLIVLAHGLFDSGAQYYVQRTAAVLFQQGHSVLLPDMRDHGDTLRAAPDVATTLGVLEGPDLLALAGIVRQACAERVTRVGLAGVSGGGLAAIRAFTLDSAHALDAGVLALSPLLDVDTAISDLSQAGPCAITRSIELTWVDVALLSAATGALTFAGAAASRAWTGEPLTASAAAIGGIGLGAGALLGSAADAWLDGSSDACVSQHAIAQMVQDALRVRWRALRALDGSRYLSPAGMKLDPDSITLDHYMRERVQFLAARDHVSLRRFDPSTLAHDLRRTQRTSHSDKPRLLVLGAEDDPMTRKAALLAFIEHARDIPQVYARAVQHGGHAAFLLVQPTLTERLLAAFFRAE